MITGNRAVIDCLVSAQASPDLQDRNGNSAVHLAVLYGSQTCLTALLKAQKRPDWNMKNYEGKLKIMLFLAKIIAALVMNPAHEKGLKSLQMNLGGALIIRVYPLSGSFMLFYLH